MLRFHKGTAFIGIALFNRLYIGLQHNRLAIFRFRMTDKHTPGPWHIKPQRQGGPQIWAERVQVAFAFAGDKQPAEANARLIAAAPTAPHECDPDCPGEQNRRKLDTFSELLEALEHSLPYMERAVKFFKYQRVGHEFYPNREEAEANIQEARAAIEATRKS